jgi:hypothetical protein
MKHIVGALVGVLLATTACIPVDPINDAVRALDQAKDEILIQSQDWQLTLKNITKDLGEDARNLIQYDVDQLVQRSLGAVQTQVTCIIDMIGERVAEGLERIKASLRNQEYQRPSPSVCQASPNSISLGAPIETRQMVELFGYDFDSPAALTVEHIISSAPKPDDVTEILSVQTPYHATLAISRLTLGADSTHIRVNGTKGVPVTLEVFQAPPRSCKRMESQTAPDNVTVPAELKRDDAEFYGNGPLISVGFSLENLGSSLKATLGIVAQEQFLFAGKYINGGTYAEGQSSWTIYEPPPNWEVVSFQPSGSLDGHTSRDNSWLPESVNSEGKSLVKQWVIVGDINGVDVGVPGGTSVTALFSTLKVQIAEKPGTEGCVVS